MKRLPLPEFAARVSLASERERLLRRHMEMITAMDAGLKSYDGSFCAHLEELDKAAMGQINFH